MLLSADPDHPRCRPSLSYQSGRTSFPILISGLARTSRSIFHQQMTSMYPQWFCTCLTGRCKFRLFESSRPQNCRSDIAAFDVRTFVEISPQTRILGHGNIGSWSDSLSENVDSAARDVWLVDSAPIVPTARFQRCVDVTFVFRLTRSG